MVVPLHLIVPTDEFPNDFKKLVSWYSEKDVTVVARFGVNKRTLKKIMKDLPQQFIDCKEYYGR